MIAYEAKTELKAGCRALHNLVTLVQSDRRLDVAINPCPVLRKYASTQVVDRFRLILTVQTREDRPSLTSVLLCGIALALSGAMETTNTQTGAPRVAALADIERGFPPSRLENQSEPKIKKDARGHYILTISENIKVYFEDYYQFLELIGSRTAQILAENDTKLADVDSAHQETLAFHRARRIVLDVTMRTVRAFYSDKHNLGVIMTPWCFGTVVLEKVEMLRDRIARGDASHLDVGDYPYDVVRYINEIRVPVLMEVLDFPPKAFSMRWQYTELVRRYSSALTNVTTSLQSILDMMKKHGQ